MGIGDKTKGMKKKLVIGMGEVLRNVGIYASYQLHDGTDRDIERLRCVEGYMGKKIKLTRGQHGRNIVSLVKRYYRCKKLDRNLRNTIAKEGNHFLLSWYLGQDKKIHWQIIEQSHYEVAVAA